MDDAELGHATREPGHIGVHDGPLLAKQVPDAAVNLWFVGAWLQALFDQPFQAILRRAVSDLKSESHSLSPKDSG